MEKDYYQLELDDMVIALENKDYEIKHLKELLKECKECFELLTNDNSPWCPPEADTLLVKINQVLGEE